MEEGSKGCREGRGEGGRCMVNTISCRRNTFHRVLQYLVMVIVVLHVTGLTVVGESGGGGDGWRRGAVA